MALKKLGKKDPLPIIKKFEVIQGGEGGGDESNWLVSYADMMTLLCGFFIMMFSMATLDAPKYDSFKESIAKQFGGEYKSPSKETAKYLTNIIQELGIDKEAVVASDPLGASVTFESTMFFDTLSADVSSKGKEILNKLIGAIGKRQAETTKKYRIVVEGHTDGRPVLSGNFPSNWELSGARSSRVVRLFLENGFTPERLTAIGYADTRPVMPERRADGTWDEQALLKNRRVVLRVLEPNVDAIPFPDQASGGAPVTGVAPAKPAATGPGAGTSAPAGAAPATAPAQATPSVIAPKAPTAASAPANSGPTSVANPVMNSAANPAANSAPKLAPNSQTQIRAPQNFAPQSNSVAPSVSQPSQSGATSTGPTASAIAPVTPSTTTPGAPVRAITPVQAAVPPQPLAPISAKPASPPIR